MRTHLPHPVPVKKLPPRKAVPVARRKKPVLDDPLFFMPGGEDAAKAFDWFLLYTAPLCEFDAFEMLRAADVAAFVPTGLRVYRPGRTRNTQPQRFVAFQRYLFVGLHPQKPAWQRIHDVPFCVGAVCIDGEPLRVRPVVIERLRRLEKSGDLDEEEPAQTLLTKLKSGAVMAGAKVRIASGPLQGFEGRITIEGLNERGELRLDVSNNAITAPLDIVELLG